MSDQDKGQDEYHFFRAHDWDGGWGVKNKHEEVVALCYHQHYAKAIADLLNNYDDPHGLLNTTK